MTDSGRRIAFPRMGSYNAALKYIVENGAGAEYVMAPPMTRHTLELGTRNSPDFVCAPYKYTLGSMMEAVDECGANVLIEMGGVCRLGYYGELQRQTLSDLGYNVEFVNMADMGKNYREGYYDLLKKMNPHASVLRAVMKLYGMGRMLEAIDEIEGIIRRDEGFEVKRGEMKDIHEQFIGDCCACKKLSDVRRARKKALAALAAAELKKPEKPLRVGIVGEYYTVMDPFSNHNVENILGCMGEGVEIYRDMTFTERNLHYDEKRDLKLIAPYVRYSMGPTTSSTIASAIRFAEQGFDGIVHIKSFGCTPEVDAMSVLQNISADRKIPILYLSYDSQTGDAGIQTRLEAFYDMIDMKRGRA